ncbi:hypothetical protein [Leucobacter salsicius]|uniref:hypothetical protein n=1 Tax=Leucobacter salsicius TaxID=664638 RepID=UPI0012F82134|nr:hypothetical protein [Leucobacter salsicius]
MGGMPWNPMMAVQRVSDDEGHLYDGNVRVAILRQVRIGRPSALLWRSVTGDQAPDDRHLVGYFPSIQMAAAVTWRSWNQRHKPVEQHALA